LWPGRSTKRFGRELGDKSRDKSTYQEPASSRFSSENCSLLAQWFSRRLRPFPATPARWPPVLRENMLARREPLSAKYLVNSCQARRQSRCWARVVKSSARGRRCPAVFICNQSDAACPNWIWPDTSRARGRLYCNQRASQAWTPRHRRQQPHRSKVACSIPHTSVTSKTVRRSVQPPVIHKFRDGRAVGNDEVEFLGERRFPGPAAPTPGLLWAGQSHPGGPNADPIGR